jgi:hypothetical protein
MRAIGIASRFRLQLQGIKIMSENEQPKSNDKDDEIAAMRQKLIQLTERIFFLEQKLANCEAREREMVS